MEGINIPNLRRIVYAAGMKEQKRVLQAMGRGLRVTDTKETITLVDFLDPYKYISQHSILRVQIYNEQKWFN
jgi:superfamily II DNA or RNA helicase